MENRCFDDVIMQHFSRRQLLTRWDAVPDVLREAVFSNVNELFLDDVATKFHFSDSQRADMAYLCLLVFFGFVSYRSVMRELQEEFQLDSTTALALYQQLDAKLFEPIRKDIEDNFLKFNAGVTNEASVQKPEIVSQVNLKTDRPDDVVNLKKGEVGPKILSVGAGVAGTASVPVPPLSRPGQKTATSDTPAITPMMVQTNRGPSLAAPPSSPTLSHRMPSAGNKDIFSLSPKDLWGIEKENKTAIERMTGGRRMDADTLSTSSAPISSSGVRIVPSSDRPLSVGGAPADNRPQGAVLPDIVQSHLPEIPPVVPLPEKMSDFETSHGAEYQKKKIPPSLPAFEKIVSPKPKSEGMISAPKATVPPHPSTPNPPSPAPAPAPSPSAPTPINITVQVVPENVIHGSVVSPPPGSPNQESGMTMAPSFVSPVTGSQVMSAVPSPRGVAPASTPRPMQWAAPASPPSRPDVVVEIRQTNQDQFSVAGEIAREESRTKRDAPLRPMKTSTPVSSRPSAIESSNVVANAPMAASHHPAVSQPLNPADVVDMGPVIIHRRDENVVARQSPDAGYKDFPSVLNTKISSQSSRPPAIASLSKNPTPSAPLDASSLGGANGSRQATSFPSDGVVHATAPVSSQNKGKKGFFSFLKKW